MGDLVGQDEFWLFGYGSLIWKPPPHFDQRIPGYINGYVRRFWQILQASEDHRGTPEAPGRVVTLIERSFWETLTDDHAAAEDRVWGTAYRIAPSKVEEVREYLDIREINGYSIHYTPFYPADASQPPIRCLVYIGLPSNPQFVGPQDPQKLAEHIYRSHGPSGDNKEYLFMLETALRDLSRESGDIHISDLAERVKGLEAARLDASGPNLPDEAIGKVVEDKAVGNELTRIGSTEEQEEVEKFV
ncbi:MAG: hypothetical protein M1819_001861 [Sarea resinae]|nr:MAG: hypothetical protein M1819_001861 [Sarea resinae]